MLIPFILLGIILWFGLGVTFTIKALKRKTTVFYNCNYKHEGSCRPAKCIEEYLDTIYYPAVFWGIVCPIFSGLFCLCHYVADFATKPEPVENGEPKPTSFKEN